MQQEKPPAGETAQRLKQKTRKHSKRETEAFAGKRSPKPTAREGKNHPKHEKPRCKDADGVRPWRYSRVKDGRLRATGEPELGRHRRDTAEDAGTGSTRSRDHSEEESNGKEQTGQVEVSSGLK
ncbi:Hypothetical predicted protein [Pelobates cultripes]|uniref:Uncharacterized protein n=1 Tax=Pelobates cultripes TaxID=61616 RepID=A0AAD1VYI9_PELCU|nr:Hypothetical predicted protein [Pelobates cultripes]